MYWTLQESFAEFRGSGIGELGVGSLKRNGMEYEKNASIE